MTCDPQDAAMDGSTRFRILGPLEAVRHGRPLPLGGARRRAVLGYLLLYPNEVVAVSRLTAALWADGAPASARKILQNAVWQLRRVLEPDADPADRGESGLLVTRAPGYLLRVDPGRIDLCRFQELAAAGRAALRAGSPGQAGALWQQALGLWRGPALGDLSEDGVSWPELRAAHNARLDLQEDYFDAELSLGHHDAVLPELMATARAEPRRERLLRLLMLALYRSGRHSDALDAFDGARSELAEDLGLEPGRALRELRQAILTHDPSLLHTPVPSSARAVDPRQPSGAEDGGRRPEPGAGAEPGLARTFVERREVSVAVVRAVLLARAAPPDPEDLDAAVLAVREAVELEARRFGGIVVAEVASSWIVVFGARRAHDDDACRAVQLALAVRHRLAVAPPSQPPVAVQAVVDSGEALVRGRLGVGAPPLVTAAAVDRCLSVLPLVPRGEVRVGEETRRRTEDAVRYQPAYGVLATWTATGLRVPDDAASTVLLGRERESAALLEAVRPAAAQPRPRLVLVTAGPGLGKTRLIHEATRRAAGAAPPQAALVVCLPPRIVDDSSLAGVARDLSACCDIGPHDTPEDAGGKLRRTVRRVARTAREADWLLARLHAPLLGAGGLAPSTDLGQAADAWWCFVQRIAGERTVIAVADDLHAADEAALDRLDRLLADESVAPGLRVVAGARPELFERRPAWLGDVRHIMPLTLSALPDETVGRLARLLLRASGPIPAAAAHDVGGGVASQEMSEACDLVVSLSRGNPGLAAQFARHAVDLARADGAGFGDGCSDARARLLPARVRSMLAAAIDTLPEEAREAVLDASVAGHRFSRVAVAAVQDRDADAVGPILDGLADRGLLVREPLSTAAGDVEYSFASPLLAYVACARIPRSRAAAKRAALAAWSREAGAPGGAAARDDASPDAAAGRLLRLAGLVRRNLARRAAGHGDDGSDRDGPVQWRSDHRALSTSAPTAPV